MDRVQYESLIIQDILNLHKSGELELSPWYQRRSVWTTPQKSYLINTLTEQKPIPAIYIRHSLDLEKGKSIKEVVDGQQRMRAIISFCENEFTVRYSPTGKKKKFTQLNAQQRQAFLLTAIPVGYLLGATDEDVIDIFGRINSVSKTLNAQEKRNAAYSGEFKQFCLYQASSRVEFWRSYNLFSANDIARMNEVQFISDLALNLMEGLSDYSTPKLNNAYKKFDEEFPFHEETGIRLDRLFDFIVSLDVSVIRDTIFKRQPIFFSLLIVLDSIMDLDRAKVEDALHEIDARFNADQQQTEEDMQFIAASTASTQRLKQRRVRDRYIRSFLA